MYQVRRITCPVCGHRFTEFLTAGTYEIAGYSGRWEKLRCTVCEKEIFVNEEKDYPLLVDEVESRRVGIVLT